MRLCHRGLLKISTVTGLLLLLCVPCYGQKEIRFVTWRADPQWVWDQAIADFEAQNPGIRVVREVGPHSSTEFHDLLTQKLKNRDPEVDVFFMDVIWPAEFAAAGWALPLERFFSRAEQNEFLEAAIHITKEMANLETN